MTVDHIREDYAPCCSDCGDENHQAGWPHCPLTKAKRLRNAEQNEILGWCLDLAAGPTGDGGVKRAAGTKPYWKHDPGHAAAMGRHLAKWEAGERYDSDSGCHHLQHVLVRAAMLAYQEMAEDGLIPEDPR
jgi:hypothetical protein